ncbi:MAG TPA: 1-acyl-sn-glycerol-3-phosphate acyltransferase [Gemmatimonadales bacterium]|nr:1-acyl-sn-glycerol-3-phosphate acyltransferase [Gemmatimonadales bacterium]
MPAGPPRLLPLVGPLARLITGAYYRVILAGRPLPERGPLLIVANHPNEVFDPLLVAAAAGRAVRFLAKAPLFGVPGVGAILRAAGCLPVYRRSDDPGQTARNEATFAAVTAALGHGAAVALFPEGTSHDSPALAPLKTGAARIALGASRAGVPLAVVPAGLVLADRDRARSEALVLLGPPLAWDDLRGAGPVPEAVRDLTARITSALEAVTVNLEAWADEPLVTTAEAIHAATHAVPSDPAERVRRLWLAGRWLRALRASHDARYRPLAAGLRAHGRKLARIGLAPADLREASDVGTALRWTGRRLPLLAAGAVALAGLLLVTGPMIVADLVTRGRTGGQEGHASRHLYVGSALVLLWWAILTTGAWLARGPLAAAAAAAALPVAGFLGLAVQQAWGRRLHQARRWLVLRFGGGWLRALRAEQAALGEALDELLGRPPAGAERELQPGR